VQSTLPWETRKGRVLAAKPLLNLEPAENALLLFLLCVAGGLLCLALTAWLGWGVIRSLIRGGLDLLPGLYAGFAAFGVVQSVKYGRRFLYNARNPSPKLGLRPAVLVPGQNFNVAWVWKNGARSAQPFRLWLEGREEVFVSQVVATMHGKMKEEKLQKAPFAGRLLAELPNEATGTRQFKLPEDVMPSFESARAKIVWHLRVEVISESGASFHEHKVFIRTPPA
jgi:hypothetical protein